MRARQQGIRNVVRFLLFENKTAYSQKISRRMRRRRCAGILFATYEITRIQIRAKSDGVGFCVLRQYRKAHAYRRKRNASAVGVRKLFGAEDLVETEILNDQAKRVFDALGDDCTKKIFYLYYWEGYNLREIAQLLSLNISTIKQRHARGIKKIKNLL